MIHELEDARHVRAATYALRWRDGHTAELDLTPLIESRHALSPLADAGLIGQGRIDNGGDTLSWPGGIDIDATVLRQMATRGTLDGALARTDADLLMAAGPLLFGRNWKTELAETLGWRDAARVREMLRGRRRVPPGAMARLHALLEARASACAVLAGDIAPALGGEENEAAGAR